MAPIPTRSPVTGHEVPAHYVHASEAHFRLNDGRTILLRGINLAASAKTPVGQPGAKLEGFWEGAKSGQLDFVGRVLELDQADLHLERLKSWGFNVLRFVTTWESIEHEGPGKYDQAYFDYVVQLLRKCKEWGFYVYMDPHQDLWSRFSGGSGAPYWTILACGLEPEHFTVTRAAVIECEWPHPLNPDPASFPPMIWATNYSRLACQTLFTMFFAGRDYAPKCIINGKNIQDYLQDHYFDAYRALGKAIGDAGDLFDECVIGWDSLNEPNPGYLGTADLNSHGKESVLRVGPMPTAFQAMKLGMGHACEVENWKSGSLGPKRDGSVLVEPKGVIAWLDPERDAEAASQYGWERDAGWKMGTCVWAQHGIWDVETLELHTPNYFDEYKGSTNADKPRPVEFGQDYWLAHWRKWAPVVRSVHPEAIHFVHSPVFQVPPRIEGPEIQGRAVFSSHFYDGLTLVTKHWNWFNADALGILRGHYRSIVFGVKVGEAAIRRCMRSQLGMLRQDGLDKLGQFPTMMGEIGIPYDLDHKKAYKDGNYSTQVRALDASLNACDGDNVLNYTVWNYCPDNSHEWGDCWNGEDLTVWSPDDAVKSIAAREGGSNRNQEPHDERQQRQAEQNRDYSSHPEMSNSSTPSQSGRSTPVDTSSSSTVAANENPSHPINLNDGARALPAFCRPFPVKTVGTPIEIDFDVTTSKCTLSIRVEADDVADPDLPTEVYVPLAHYAKYPSAMSYAVAQAAVEDAHALKDSTRTGDLALGDDKKRDNSDATALALKVKVSAGRYEIEDQKLKWYYPRPSSGSVTLKIEFERTGGPIPLWVSQWQRAGRARPVGHNWMDAANTLSARGHAGSAAGIGLLSLVGLCYAAMSFCTKA
ncbi:uncharacterized protein JCM15063_001473 [Sporobolomyces koalae]|uniref:uncharacterized protein n=1 Tax=Sporobolomyces koalae TaxID=500713 RepID=UPI003174D816